MRHDLEKSSLNNKFFRQIHRRFAQFDTENIEEQGASRSLEYNPSCTKGILQTLGSPCPSVYKFGSN